MIKLLHTGDIHIGKQFPSLKVKADEYRSQLTNTFEKIVDLAGLEKVSLVLITGDLFDTNRVYGLTVNRTLSIFKKLEGSNIRVCLIPGSHDDYGEDSIYRSLPFPPNVTILTPERSRQAFTDLNLTIYGMVPGTGSWETSPLQGLSPIRESRFHVGMAHCMVDSGENKPDDQVVLERSEIANSGLDYLALGHRHFFQDCSQGNTPACYCGSPEPIDMDLPGSGRVVMVTLTEDNKAQFQVIPIGTNKCDSVTIDVTNFDSIESIVPMIHTRSDPNLILQVFLTGTNRIDNFANVQEIEDLLSDRFFNLRIIDNSHSDLAAVNLQNYPDKTVTGRYLRILQDKITAAANPEDKALYEETLKLGFNLLQGNLKAIE